MGLLQDVVGGLMNSSGQGGSPFQGILMNMLGGGQQMGGQQMGGQQMGGQQIGAQQAGLGGLGGGLGGIISSFEQAGLGHIAQSWVGNGPNQPVSPEQLQSVLGQNQVQSMASQAGMPQQDFLSQLAQHLPNAVHQMTPDGTLPQPGTIEV